MPTNLDLGKECSRLAARIREAQSGWRSRLGGERRDAVEVAGLHAGANIVAAVLANFACDLGVPLRESFGIEESREPWVPPPPPREHSFDGELCSHCGCLRDGAIARLTCGTVQNVPPLAERKKLLCGAENTVMGNPAKCLLRHGHEGDHDCGTFKWSVLAHDEPKIINLMDALKESVAKAQQTKEAANGS